MTYLLTLLTGILLPFMMGGAAAPEVNAAAVDPSPYGTFELNLSNVEFQWREYCRISKIDGRHVEVCEAYDSQPSFDSNVTFEGHIPAQCAAPWTLNWSAYAEDRSTGVAGHIYSDGTHNEGHFSSRDGYGKTFIVEQAWLHCANNISGRLTPTGEPAVFVLPDYGAGATTPGKGKRK